MKKRLLLLIIAIGVLIYIGWVLYFAVSESSKNPIVMEKNTPKDYLNLWNSLKDNGKPSWIGFNMGIGPGDGVSWGMTSAEIK